jgi:hypothetical protein
MGYLSKVTAHRPENQGLIPGKVRNSFFVTRLRLTLGSTKLLGRGCFLGLMWPEFEAGQSLHLLLSVRFCRPSLSLPFFTIISRYLRKESIYSGHTFARVFILVPFPV